MPQPPREGRGRPKIDWAAAFAFYAALGPPRSYGAIAERFGVSLTAVRKHARREGWEARVGELDRQASVRAEACALRTLAERRVRTLQAVDLAREQIVARLQVGEEQARLADLPALVRLEQLLEGEPTERLEQSVEVLVAGVLAAVRTALAGCELEPVQAERLEQALANELRLMRTKAA